MRKPAHARASQAAHAPPAPAEHARLACFARVGGLPPPAASRLLRCAQPLLTAATPRMMGLRRLLARGRPSAIVPQHWKHASATSGRSTPRRFTSCAKREAALLHVTASNVTDLHKLAIADRPHHAGGRRGSERAAKRSSERRRGAAAP